MTGYQYKLEGGRCIGISAWGDPASRRLVVFCHPTPGAGEFDPDPLVTNSSGLRFVAVDRPGYGGSDPFASDVEPTIERFADDIAEYLRGTIYSDANPQGNQFPQVSVVGWSFGGAVALSLAARHQGHVGRVDAISTMRPRRSREGERYSEVMELRKRGVERNRDSLAATLDDEPEPDVQSLGIGADDPALENWGLDARLENMLETSYLRGALGVASDRVAARDLGWTGELDQIRCECVFSYGGSDEVSGERDANWYARRISGARILRLDGGHGAIASAWAQLLLSISAGFDGRDARHGAGEPDPQ